MSGPHAEGPAAHTEAAAAAAIAALTASLVGYALITPWTDGRVAVEVYLGGIRRLAVHATPATGDAALTSGIATLTAHGWRPTSEWRSWLGAWRAEVTR